MPIRPSALRIPAVALIAFSAASAGAIEPAPVRFAESQEILPRSASVEMADLDGVPGDEILYVEGGGVRFMRHVGDRALSSPAEVSLPAAPHQFVVHDFDEDGLPDLAARSATSLMVRRNLGGLAFEAARVWSVPSGARTMLKGDLDGDGRMDLLFVHTDSLRAFRGDPVLLLEQLPARPLPPDFDPTANRRWAGSSLGDLDGDGRADLVHNNYTTRTGRLLLSPGGGDGGFGAAVVVDTAVAADVDLLVADLDADGRDDLAYGVYQPASRLRWARSLGGGAFQVREWSGTSFVSAPIFLAATDLDRNGALDVLIAGRWTAGGPPSHTALVQVVFDAGNEALASLTGWHARADWFENWNVATGDPDGDGWPDVSTSLVGDYFYYSRCVLLWNAGDGALLGLQEITPGGVINAWPGSLHATRRAPAALPDLVAPYDGRLRLLRNRGNGAFRVADDLGAQPAQACADLDGDGAEDLIVSDPAGLRVLRRDPAGGGFAPHGPAIAGGAFVALADFDGDGRRDLVLENAASLVRLPGDGAGGFGPAEPMGLTFPVARGPALAVDLDADGRSDLVWAPRDGACSGDHPGAVVRVPLHRHLADAAGRLGGAAVETLTVVTNYCAARTHRLAAGDVDGDGDPDVAIVSRTDPFWYGVFLNDGAGGLRAAGPGALGGQYGGPLAVRDLNGDGFAEVVVHESSGSEWDVEIFLSRGDGTFEPAPTLIGGRAVSDIVIEDFDGDGRPDVAAQAGYLEGLVVLRNVTPFPPPTPALAAFSAARFEGGAVALEWFAPGGGAFSAALERALDDGPWEAIARVASDGAGRGTYLDRATAPGRRHGYRLRHAAHGLERVSAEVWVDVPRPALALSGPLPNPARGAVVFALALPAPGDATLEVFDVAGRRVRAFALAGLAAGEHRVALGGAPLAPGLYVARLRAGAAAAVLRFAAVP